jgi:hypothetical protein
VDAGVRGGGFEVVAELDGSDDLRGYFGGEFRRPAARVPGNGASRFVGGHQCFTAQQTATIVVSVAVAIQMAAASGLGFRRAVWLR